MEIKERTARMAQNLLCGIPHEIRNRRSYSEIALSEAIEGIRQISAIGAIREVASRMPADVSPDGLLDELLCVAAKKLAASGRELGAALLREMFCLYEPAI